MKKCLSVMLAALLLLTMLPLGAIGVSAAISGDYTYTIFDGEAIITDYDGEGGNITIPSQLGGYPVVALGMKSFAFCDGVTSVTIPNSVKRIEEYAFQLCFDLTVVTMGNSITRIGERAFAECSSLTTVTIGNNAATEAKTYIHYGVFERCTRLTSLNIGRVVKTIDWNAFDRCTSLTSVTIPDSVTYIGPSIFRECTSLTEIVVDNANPNYSSLDGVLFNKDRTMLIQYPGGKSGSFKIPNTMTGIYQYALDSCVNLTGFDVEDANQAYSAEDGVLFNKEKSTLVRYPQGKEGAYTLPNGVNRIGENSFLYCDKLTLITIPDGVNTIEQNAFFSCDGLTSVTLPISIAEIGESAFGDYGNLTDVYYAGNKEQATTIVIGASNENLFNATWHYRSDLSISKEPTTGYAKMGEKVSVKVTAEGEGLRYEWYIKNNGAKKYSKSSVTSATYSTTMSDKAKGRRVYCVITDLYGNKVQTKTVLLREAASITKQPATVAYAKKGAKVSVKITAKGDGLKYAWYIKNEGGSKYSKSSVTSATYSTTMSSKVKGRRIYCIVTDKYGKTVQSKTFLLRESVSITTQPKTVTVAKNKTAKVTVKASGDGLKYTWYIKNAGSSKYSKSSVKTASYSAKMTSKVKNRQVYCVVTDKYGKTVKTVTVKLKMK